MIGIDVVDINDPLLKQRGERALKLITHYRDTYPNHPHTFWLLWTAKEAVFKSQRARIPFSPKNIPVNIRYQENILEFQSGKVVGKYQIGEGYIGAYCSLEHQDIQFEFWERKLPNASTEVRERLQNQVKKSKITLDSLDLPLIASSGLPVSFTHHGDYCGYACLTS